MANVMSMKSVRNKPHRDGFDLSKRNLFTAKIGELLPVYCKEVLPGDKFKINQKWFTRTRPVNTAAYTRIREYYDWFFVPTNLLWNKFETFISQTKENPFHAASINDAQYTNDTHPFMNVSEIYDFLYRLAGSDGGVNFFGFEKVPLICKLLHYLGYGDYYNWEEPGSAYLRYREDAALNPFPLLAYQKIYQDYFRNSQWEKSAPWTCNLDYLFLPNPYQNRHLRIKSEDINVSEDSLFDLRYANWHKDLFMGVLPSAQFGDAASVDLSSMLDFVDTADFDGFNIVSGVSSSGSVKVNSYGYLFSENSLASTDVWNLTSGSVENIAGAMGLTRDNLMSVFTILALRQAEAMQKWKEITQSTQQDYKSQMEAHFGVSLSDAYSERCKFIDGFVNNVDISEVVNTNLADTSVEANIAGKGVGVGDVTLSFESKVHGYIMCIYHAVPLLDYSNTGISRQNLKTNVIDYAIPEFDQTGMVQVPLIELTNRSFTDNADSDSIFLLGYAPRYYDYKQDKDEVHGGFYNGGDESWVAPIDDSYIRNYLRSIPRTSNSIDYRFFKIPPQIVDTIFGVNATESTSTDHLLINCGFDVKAVRNLDYNGLPY